MIPQALHLHFPHKQVIKHFQDPTLRNNDCDLFCSCHYPSHLSRPHTPGSMILSPFKMLNKYKSSS